MLVLIRDGDSFADDSDEAVRYRLPSGLRPLTAPDGSSQVALSRSPDGGLLHLRLTPVWPKLAAGERRVSFADGRFRLLLRTPTASENGQWRRTAAVGDAVVDRSVSLDSLEVAIAQRLGAGGDEVIDVEVELKVQGFAPTFPWRVRADGRMVQSQLTALVGSSPADWTRIQDAFLGLDTTVFTWYPLAPAALPPPNDEALLTIALHSAPFLLDAADDGWVVRQAVPEHLELSLQVPRLDSRLIGFRWSFSEFLAAQPDPARYLTEIREPAPFEAAELLVVNDVLLSDAGVRSLEVEILTGGPTGRLRHVFRPGEPGAVRLRFVRETFEVLALSWRLKAAVYTPRGTTMTETGFRPTGLFLEVNTAALGLTPLRFRAEPDLFDTLEALEVAVGSRALQLTAESPEAWAVGRQPPPAVDVAAVLAGGRREPIGSIPIGERGLTVGATILGQGEVVEVALQPAAENASRVVYHAVQVEGGPWRTLELDGGIVWPVRRENRFAKPRLRYRTRAVPRTATGGTGPMAESDWREGEGDSVVVEV